MNYPSPRTPGSTPFHDWDFARIFSATPSPSPRPMWFDPATPRRSANRSGHTRASSYAQHGGLPPRTHLESPRYNSHGDYCTADVSAKAFPSRRTSAHYQTPPRRDRRHSYTFVRGHTPHGESDEDEIIETYGRTYVLPAQSRYESCHTAHVPLYDDGWFTNRGIYTQSSPCYAEPVYARAPPFDSPQQSRSAAQTRPPTSQGHHRHSSASVPQRPSTVRPSPSSKRSKPPQIPVKATPRDAERYRIPPGYNLKHWDPNEEPILLLGSVFDANSLGKWIYDWTVFTKKAGHPISDIAGDLWLLLIQLAGKMKRAEDGVVQLRGDERHLLNEFIDSAERLTDDLRKLLKACELPMLNAQRKGHDLGKSSGVEFVNTLFGREKELPRTEAFMQAVRTFNVRYDVNCEPILRRLGLH